MSIFVFAGLRDRGASGGQNAITINQTEVDPYNLALVIGAEEDKPGKGDLSTFCDGVFCEIGIVQMHVCRPTPHTHLRCL